MSALLHRIFWIKNCIPDYRSLVHHFENGVWMYQHEVLKAVKQDVENTMEQSLNMAEHPLKNTMGQRFVRALVRVFAPML